MKRSKLLVVGMVTVFSMLAYAPAKASTTTQSTQQQSGLLSGLSDWLNSLFGGSGSGSSSGSGSGSTGSNGTSLPINGNVWLLVVAGAIVGCKVIMDKNGKEIAQKA